MHRASDEIIIDIDFHKESVLARRRRGKREDASSAFPRVWRVNIGVKKKEERRKNEIHRQAEFHSFYCGVT